MNHKMNEEMRRKLKHGMSLDYPGRRKSTIETIAAA